jgi:dihydropteroate synthase
MGVLNVTPDSFSDGGRFVDPKTAVEHGRRMHELGAAIVDVGGESTRPGAQPVSVEEELARVRPVLEGLSGMPTSIDTSKAEVARRALELGAELVNDVTALRGDPGMAQVVAECGAFVCLMHMQGEPRTMQESPSYGDVVREVHDFLAQRVAAAQRAGIARDRIVVDPGFGFGKTASHNLQLLRRLSSFEDLGVPLLAGLSRKSTLVKITGRPVDERLAGSLAMALLALQGGARILRVHDVKETRDVIAVWQAFRDEP